MRRDRLELRGCHGKPENILPREPVMDVDGGILYIGSENGVAVAISTNVNLDGRLTQLEQSLLKTSDVSVEVEASKIVKRTGDGRVKSDLTGTADTAKALLNARRIRLTGAASGSAMFNGSKDIDIVVSLTDANGIALGSGDMRKDVYDTDGDGIVDRAKVADAVPWAGITDLPEDGFMSADDKEKLDGIEPGAQVNVQADWNATEGPAMIKNKPDLTPSEHNHDALYEPKNANIQSHIGSTENPHGTTAAQVGAEPANTNIQAHITTPGNPHGVTKNDIGLGNVDNTADTAKPVSTAQQTAINQKEDSLGNPDSDGMLLSSTADGVRIWILPTESSGALIGTENYIVSPFKVLSGSGLQALIDPNRCVIAEKEVSNTVQEAIALNARSAQLVYKKEDGTYDKVVPKITAADIVDTTTIAFWPFANWDGTSAIPNGAIGVNGNTKAVTNNLNIGSGLTRVDGHAGYACKGNASAGLSVSNLTNFPTGANQREITVQFTFSDLNVSTTTRLFGGSVSGGTLFGLSWLGSATNKAFAMTVNSSDYDTSFIPEYGKKYNVSFVFDGSNIRLRIDGAEVYSLSVSYSATWNAFSALNLGWCASGVGSTSVIDYIEIRDTVRTPAQLVALMQKSLIPHKGKQSYKTSPLTLTGSNASADSVNSTYTANLAVDGNTGTCWYANSSAAKPNWWKYDFGAGNEKAVKAFAIDMTGMYGGSDYYLKDFEIQYSDDDSTFVTAGVFRHSNSANNDIFVIPQEVAPHRYWRLFIINSWYSGGNVAIAEIKMYEKDDGSDSDIRDSLPNKLESVVVAYIETSSTAIKKLIHPNEPSGAMPDWAFGMRIGPMGLLNRKKFLGWKYFASNPTIDWSNPFASNKLSARFSFIQTPNERNECPIIQFDNGTNGVSPRPFPSSMIRIAVVSGVYFLGAWQTSGYLGAYVEVFE
jgi:hypothetical protein